MRRKVEKLQDLIHSMYKTEAELARKIGWTRQRLNKITNGLKEPNLTDLNTLALPLNKSVGEIAQIFLDGKSPIKQRKT